MPVNRCRKNNRPGFKWGQRGTCYVYTAGDDRGKERARARAQKDGAKKRKDDIDRRRRFD